jgi:hypothetical protein
MKDVKDLYKENHKTLKKMKMKMSHMFMDQQNKYCYVGHITEKCVNSMPSPSKFQHSSKKVKKNPKIYIKA